MTTEPTTPGGDAPQSTQTQPQTQAGAKNPAGAPKLPSPLKVGDHVNVFRVVNGPAIVTLLAEVAKIHPTPKGRGGDPRLDLILHNGQGPVALDDVGPFVDPNGTGVPRLLSTELPCWTRRG